MRVSPIVISGKNSLWLQWWIYLFDYVIPSPFLSIKTSSNHSSMLYYSWLQYNKHIMMITIYYIIVMSYHDHLSCDWTVVENSTVLVPCHIHPFIKCILCKSLEKSCLLLLKSNSGMAWVSRITGSAVKTMLFGFNVHYSVRLWYDFLFHVLNVIMNIIRWVLILLR